MKPGFERLSRWTCSFSKLFEAFYWILTGFTFVFAAALIWQDASDYLDIAQLLFPDITPPVPGAVVLIYLYVIAAFFCSALTAKIWQAIRKVFETSAGQTPASIGPTPFQPETVRLLKKIASYAIITGFINMAASLIRVIASTATSAGANHIFSSISECVSCFGSLAFGLIAFCLAHFFAYGIQLQLDSDGLV